MANPEAITAAGILQDFAAVAGLVAANGFFVASEFALVSVRKSRIDEMEASGVSGAKAVKDAVKTGVDTTKGTVEDLRKSVTVP